MPHPTKRKPKKNKPQPTIQYTQEELRMAMAVHCLLPVMANYMEDIPMLRYARNQADLFINAVLKNNTLVIGSDLNLADQQAYIQIAFTEWWEKFYDENIKED